jgi:hypothetical protein
MDQPIQLPCERGISHQAKARAAAIVDDRQDAEAAAIYELV